MYAHQDFWRTSPSWFAIRLGIVAAMAGALQLAAPAAERAAPWLRTLGRRSLLGYVASVELTYGHATGPLHGALGVPAVLAGVAAMAGVTWALAKAADALPALRTRGAAAAGMQPAP
jgi:hypothetical protein